MTEQWNVEYRIYLENAISALYIYLKRSEVPTHERQVANDCLACLLAHIAKVRTSFPELP